LWLVAMYIIVNDTGV